jgi:aldehyde:ferredoxin oxidoreductase
MKLGGYAGTVLKINLTTGAIQKEPLDERELTGKFIGPESMSFRWAYDLFKPKIDPLAEDCPVIMGSGPFAGTPVPGCNRLYALFKHPSYGGLLENSRAGSSFGTFMKWAGYDYIIITGKAEKPVYLRINNDDVKLFDASQLWGKDIYETTEILWKQYSNSSVFSIGPAGERLVNTSVGLIDKISTLGKGGLAAIFGSKKLKAMVVSGTKGITVADPERLKKIVIPIIDNIKSDPDIEKILDLGAWAAGFKMWFIDLGASHRNWRTTYPLDKAHQLYSADVYINNIKKDRMCCFECPAGCKDHVQIKNGEFAGLDTYASSLVGRTEMFAARCNVGSFNRVIKCHDYSQRMGLCVHEVTALIDWAVDLYKNGIITKQDTDGLELEWDFETTFKLLEKIALNEGFGAVLGSGFPGAIKSIGRGSEKLAIHVKGMTPLYDARTNRVGAAEFGQVVNPIGAHPSRAIMPGVYLTRDIPDAHIKARVWAEETQLPADAINRMFDAPGRFNIPRLTKWLQERNLLYNTLGLGCRAGRGKKNADFYDMSMAVNIYAAVTGLETSAGELLEVATRSTNMLKVLNLREGFTRKDDKWPDRWFDPVERHGKLEYLEDYWQKPLTRQDCEKMLDEYYEECGWDINTGAPARERLIAVGLGDIAEDLQNQGYFT